MLSDILLRLAGVLPVLLLVTLLGATLTYPL